MYILHFLHTFIITIRYPSMGVCNKLNLSKVKDFLFKTLSLITNILRHKLYTTNHTFYYYLHIYTVENMASRFYCTTLCSKIIRIF